MIKNNIPKTPSIKEAMIFADMLDEIGEHKEAELIDEFIIKCASDNDLVKQAGFWGNVWSRLKGNVKKLFISEYRELYDAAKKAQSDLDQMVKKINEDFKAAKSYFKNYQFGDWKAVVSGMPLNVAPLLAPFDEKYAKFIGYVTKGFEKEEEKPEETEFEKLIKTPGGEKRKEEEQIKQEEPVEEKSKISIREIEKPLSIKDRKMEQKIEQTLKLIDKEVPPPEWHPLNSYVQNGVKGKRIDKNNIRVKTTFFNRKIGTQEVIETTDKEYIYNIEYKGKNIAENLAGAMGKTIWKVIDEDVDYIYLENTGKQVEKKKEEEKKEVPAIPVEKPVPQIGKVSPEKQVSPGVISPSVDLTKSQKRIDRIKDLEKKQPEESSIELPTVVEEKPKSSDVSPTVSTEMSPELPDKKPLTRKDWEDWQSEWVATHQGKGTAPIDVSEKPSEVDISVPPITKPKEKPKIKRRKVSGAPEGTTWVLYKQGTKYANKYAPVKNVDPSKHIKVENPNLIAKLNEQWAKTENSLSGIEYTANRIDRIKKLANLR